MVGKVNETGARGRVAPRLREGAATDDPREPGMGRAQRREATAHLGPYAPLIDAIREELEHFAASQLRLHLAIAERDRYVLTSIDVECQGNEAHHALLRRFVSEFKPEQIKQYLARDVIAGLRNAGAIDLTQFAGLNASQEAQLGETEEDPYRDLIADLQSAAPATSARAFQVTLTGRWSQADAPAPRARSADVRGDAQAHTPLAGGTFVLEIDDAGEGRRVELDAVVPGRRYAIGKDASCDVVVDGMYASRRHCEIWLERGGWCVLDTGSTNGIRVEANGRTMRAGATGQPLELPLGAMLVLSQHADGEPRQYPRLTLRPKAAFHLDTKPAEAPAAAPVTPIAPPRPRTATLTIQARMASGVREAEVAERALPFAIGRSRNQGLTVDWAHDEVSGRHLEIVGVDDDGVSVVVHGDNGVRVEGTAYPAGARLRWKPGETMLLGRADAQAPACTLTLSRRP
jgi:hypothetical protein